MSYACSHLNRNVTPHSGSISNLISVLFHPSLRATVGGGGGDYQNSYSIKVLFSVSNAFSMAPTLKLHVIEREGVLQGSCLVAINKL